MFLNARLMMSTVAALGLTALVTVPANAGLITTLEGVSFDGTNYGYTYGVALTVGSELQGTQTYFGGTGQGTIPQFGTIYDFGPVVGNTSVNGGATDITGLLGSYFTFAYENVSTPQPLNTAVPDNVTLGNIRFTYSNPNTLIYNNADQPTPLAGSVFAIGVDPGDTNLGTFTLSSTFAPGATSNLGYDSSTYNSSDISVQGNNGTVNGPDVMATAVPEPASLALLGMGMIGLGFARRRKAI